MLTTMKLPRAPRERIGEGGEADTWPSGGMDFVDQVNVFLPRAPGAESRNCKLVRLICRSL